MLLKNCAQFWDAKMNDTIFDLKNEVNLVVRQI